MSLFYGEEGRERLMCDPEEVVMDVFDSVEATVWIVSMIGIFIVLFFSV